MMKLKLLHKLTLSGYIALFIICTIGPAFSSISYSFIWSPDVHLGLTSYNTHIQFNEPTYIGNFSFVNGTHLSFTNILMNENVESFEVSAVNSNMTIITLSDSELFYNVTGAGGLQTVYLEAKTPTAVTIDGVSAIAGTNYFFEDGTAAIATANNNVSLTYSSDSDLSFITGAGSSSGLLIVVLAIGLGLFAVIVFMRKD